MLNSDPCTALAFPSRSMSGSGNAAVSHFAWAQAEDSDGTSVGRRQPIRKIESVEFHFRRITRPPRPNPTGRDTEGPRKAIIPVRGVICHDDRGQVHARPQLTCLRLLLRCERASHDVLQFGQSSRLDSNQRPTAYKAGALTAELREETRMDMDMPSLSRIIASSFLTFGERCPKTSSQHCIKLSPRAAS